MKKTSVYDSFPRPIVALRSSLLVGLLGVSVAMVTAQSVWGGLLYLLYVVAVIGFQMRIACSRCDYHGATCDLGISVLTRAFVKKKTDRGAFTPAAVRCLLPLVALLLVPMGVGIATIVLERSVLQGVLLGILVFIIVMFGITSKTMTCPRCRMRDICPLGKSIAES